MLNWVMPQRRGMRLLALMSLWLCAAVLARAAAVRGVVSDISGARIPGATVVLVCQGRMAGQAVTSGDGSFQITTGNSGQFLLFVNAPGFRVPETPIFYGGALEEIERNLVLERAWEREAILETSNGTAIPQAQTGDSTRVLEGPELEPRTDLSTLLRLMPGTTVVQFGQLGSQSDLLVRGGSTVANHVMLDGVDLGNLGGGFDFGRFSTSALERVEVLRGANSGLFGSGAEDGVVSMRTARGVTNFPVLMGRFEGGSFYSTRDEAMAAGTMRKLDYLAGFNWLQSSNSTPNDEFHAATTTGNFGWAFSGKTQLRGTLHYGVSGTGVPNAWDFYHIADSATQKDQDLFFSGLLDQQTTSSWHNSLRYGGARKREQFHQWAQVGEADSNGDTLGDTVTIRGANGYAVTGRALLDFSGSYPWHEEQVNNRDQFVYQTEYRFTQHVALVAGYRYGEERGGDRKPTASRSDSAYRTGEDYFSNVHGDYRQRFFYQLGGSVEHDSFFGTMTTPRAGVTVVVLKPKQRIFSGTRLRFAYGDGIREPGLSEEFASLNKLLVSSGFSALAEQAKIGPLAAPTSRSYEGGLEQGFCSDRINFRMNLFHDQSGRQIESVGGRMLVQILSGLTDAEKQQLITALGSYYTNDEGLTMNTQASRAMGVETQLQAGLGDRIFLRAAYTYTDAVVQRSFTSDNEELLAGSEVTHNGIPVGWMTPLKGARPFRRPPHTGSLTASYAGQKITGSFSLAMASRSDDSTYLYDAGYGSTLALPNRNLNYGWVKMDLGGSVRLRSWVYGTAQAENLFNEQHIAPLGYVSLPLTLRAGVRLVWGVSH